MRPGIRRERLTSFPAAERDCAAPTALCLCSSLAAVRTVRCWFQFAVNAFCWWQLFQTARGSQPVQLELGFLLVCS